MLFNYLHILNTFLERKFFQIKTSDNQKKIVLIMASVLWVNIVFLAGACECEVGVFFFFYLVQAEIFIFHEACGCPLLSQSIELLAKPSRRNNSEVKKQGHSVLGLDIVGSQFYTSVSNKNAASVFRVPELYSSIC
jgi:hypothetical protein